MTNIHFSLAAILAVLCFGLTLPNGSSWAKRDSKPDVIVIFNEGKTYFAEASRDSQDGFLCLAGTPAFRSNSRVTSLNGSCATKVNKK